MVGGPTANVVLDEPLPEEVPSGFATDTVIDPAVATKFAETAACSWVELTKVVVNDVAFVCASVRGTKSTPWIAMSLSLVEPDTELVLLAVLVHSTVEP